MDVTLIATKLRPPALPRRGVHRARLVEALEDSAPFAKLTLLSAAAGYGKTTLLADWVQSSRLRIAWLSIDREDNEPDRFLRYLVAAWATLRPEVNDSPLGLLASSIGPERDAILSAFVNLADELSDPIVFVLDDYHLIETPSVHQILTFLIDRLPTHAHLVVAGREDPPLPISRYRARGQLHEIRAGALAFSPEEAAEFLGGVMGLDLTADEQASLQQDVEGWIVGLQMAALTLRHRSGIVQGSPITGRNRFIADYLSEDVLAPLAPALRQFLLQTSILDQLCGPLCDAVTRLIGGQETLELLERENLFLVSLDDRRDWFRYHHLFAEVLREELSRHYAEDVAGLHGRAARWYLDHDLPDQAFNHAVTSGDVRLVAEVFDRYGNAKLLAGELNVLRRWLDAVKPEWYDAFPFIGLAEAGYLIYTGNVEACIRRVDEVEHQLRVLGTEDAPWQMARLTTVRCLMACTQNDVPRAEAYARRALEQLPEEDLGFRPMIFAALGDAYRQTGRWADAKECYLTVLGASHSPAVRVEAAHIHGALADLALLQGGLRAAATHWRQALAAVEDQSSWGHRSLPMMGWMHIRLGEIQYEWDEREEARGSLAHGLERAELGGDVRALIAGYLLASRLELAAGNMEAAGEHLAGAGPLVEQAQFPDWVSRFERLQLEHWLAQGHTRAAFEWVDRKLQDGALEQRAEDDNVRLAVARALIAKGDVGSREQALALLERLQADAEAEGRKGILIEALALQSLARWLRGELPAAMTSLEKALRRAEPEGYVRLFADFGLPLVRPLQEAHTRGIFPEYVARLLAVLGAGHRWAPGDQAPLLEPLSPREVEILALIAAGLTNREVADRLVISPETVKKHASTILGKLGVTNRTQAVTRARELGWLD